jgi:hypothetical protein
MSEPVVVNWDRIIHKNVRSKDYEDVGNVFAVLGDEVTIMGSRSREYKLPKSCIEGFNGSEVFLNILFNELGNYAVKV